MPAKKTAAAKPSRPRYSPHPMLTNEQKARDKLAADTGRTWDQWIALARAKGPTAHKDLRAWLQREHGVRSMTAWSLASGALGSEGVDYGDPETLVAALYSGPAAAARPIHERLVDAVLALGGDAIVTSCKTMVPCYRKHAFAQMRPADGGVEVQLALGGARAAGRLEPARNRAPGDRMSHRVVVRAAKDVDAELKGWLAQAYALGAGKIVRAAGATRVPADFAKSLQMSKPATATWGTCTAAMQRDFIVWIEQAKQTETRARRIAQSVARLADGRRKSY